MPTSMDYLLGQTEREWSRLEEQHALWGPILLQNLRELGMAGGQRVLEVGCGTGTLLHDLATVVTASPGGAAYGLELDPTATAQAQARVGDLAEVRAGDLLKADLGGPYDLVVARWVFSFLADAPAGVARLRDTLAPGGWLVVMDYNHDGLGVWPRHPVMDRVIAAYRAAYRGRGGDVWVGAHMPTHVVNAGLVDVRIWPHVMVGGRDTAVWRWFGRFLLEHLHTLVEDGHLTESEAEETVAVWGELQHTPGATFFSPYQVVVAARLPPIP